MVVTQAQLARRALVKVLLSLASVYAVLLSITRESNDADVLAGFKKLIRKVHPDKSGKKEDCQRLQSAKDAWDVAKRAHKTRLRADGSHWRLSRALASRRNATIAAER